MHFKTCRVCGKPHRTSHKYGTVCDSCKEFKEQYRLDMLRNTLRLRKEDC